MLARKRPDHEGNPVNKFVALMRRYCNDYTNRQDFAVCDEVMVPGYILHMGTYDLAGRDDNYKPATRKQFEQFPGLCLTVHEIVTNGDRLLLRFSEHGASMPHDGAHCAWSGIGLYKWDGERLTENYVEQDYYSRRGQLASGRPNPVVSPAIAPWDTRPRPSNPAAEAVVRQVLEHGDLAAVAGIVFDDAWHAGPAHRLLAPDGAVIDDLFSAGDQVAFHIAQSGRLLAGFGEGDAADGGQRVMLHMSGVVTVADGAIVAGHVIRDRLGLLRRLSK
jgi:predicted ester cyclase